MGSNMRNFRVQKKYNLSKRFWHALTRPNLRRALRHFHLGGKVEHLNENAENSHARFSTFFFSPNFIVFFFLCCNFLIFVRFRMVPSGSLQCRTVPFSRDHFVINGQHSYKSIHRTFWCPEERCSECNWFSCLAIAHFALVFSHFVLSVAVLSEMPVLC